MLSETIALGREIILDGLVKQLEEEGESLTTDELARLRGSLTDSLVRDILVEVASWED
jgi:hypothetical protein|tara:strand:+ start:126 stop:299 length:174 start_codon:yes stop_codon:yes gene_type:complete